MRVRNKPWAIKYLKEHEDIASDKLNFDACFCDRNKPIQIEIGGGKGQFITELAKLNPNINFLMFERVASIAALATKKIVENKINNVRIIYNNNFLKIADQIKKEKIDTIYLNFPDPWPKKRHEKRRLTSNFFIDIYHHILKKNGKIFFKTDQKKLYEYSKITINKKKFKITRNNKKLYYFTIQTEYENKFRQKNRTIYHLVFEKI